VTQRTAADAEESARASEEMNAQAGEMKTFVGDLTLLVNGRTNGHVAVERESPGSRLTRLIHKTGKDLPAPKGAPVHGVLAQKTKVVRPEQVIPLEVEGEQFRAF
jgi:methyl-accepting chemotaxis protein